jgi:hypothetical protein
MIENMVVSSITECRLQGYMYRYILLVYTLTYHMVLQLVSGHNQ